MNKLPPDSEQDVRIARDIEAVQRIDAVPSILRLIWGKTGMGFAAVARVTERSWTACAVQDDVNFGLAAGGELELHTTLCFESRGARASIVIDNFHNDPVYNGHHTARIYNSGSYISVPIILPDGSGQGLRAVLATACQQARRRTWSRPLYLQADRERAWRHA